MDGICPEKINRFAFQLTLGRLSRPFLYIYIYGVCFVSVNIIRRRLKDVCGTNIGTYIHMYVGYSPICQVSCMDKVKVVGFNKP